MVAKFNIKFYVVRNDVSPEIAIDHMGNYIDSF